MGTLHQGTTERAQRVIAMRNVVVHLLADCNVETERASVTTGTEDLAIVNCDSRMIAELFSAFVAECTSNFRVVRSGDSYTRLYVYRVGSFYRNELYDSSVYQRH